MSVIRIDKTCVVAFILIYLSDILKFAQRVTLNSSSRNRWCNGSSGSLEKSCFTDIFSEHSHIEEKFDSARAYTALDNIVTVFRVLSLFSLFIPIFQVSWLLSRGFKRRMANHITIFLLSLAGGMSELFAGLMLIGTRGMVHWLSRDFELNDWGVGNNGEDGIGWRVLQLSYMMNRALVTWVDAFEWLSLCGIFTILLLDVYAEHKTLKEGAVTFSKGWAMLGFAIGWLGWFEFIADVLRVADWSVFDNIARAITTINLWLLVPIWLLMTGTQLPKMKDKFEDRDGQGGSQVQDEQQPFEAVELLTSSTTTTTTSPAIID